MNVFLADTCKFTWYFNKAYFSVWSYPPAKLACPMLFQRSMCTQCRRRQSHDRRYTTPQIQQQHDNQTHWDSTLP